MPSRGAWSSTLGLAPSLTLQARLEEVRPGASISIVSRKVVLLSSPIAKGGLRGVLQAGKNLPQPLLAYVFSVPADIY